MAAPIHHHPAELWLPPSCSALSSQSYLISSGHVLEASNPSPSSGSNTGSGLSSSPSPSSGNGRSREEDPHHEFTAELTRRMTHYMFQELEEDDDDGYYSLPSVYGCPHQQVHISSIKYHRQKSGCDLGEFMGIKKSPRCSADTRPPQSSPIIWLPAPAPSPAMEMERQAPHDLIHQFEKTGIVRAHERSCRRRKTKAPLFGAALLAHKSQNQRLVHHPLNSNLALGVAEEEMVESRRDLQLIKPERLAISIAKNSRHRRRGPGLHHRSHHQVQSHEGSGMQAFFLGAGSRSGGGTGVFLPRGAAGNSTDQWRNHHPTPRTGCSTVLIPARVAQALVAHFERINSKQQRASTADIGRRLGLHSRQKSQARPAPGLNDIDANLPQEWIY